MYNINSYRKFIQKDHKPDSSGEYVIYWMQINCRLSYNFALEYAVHWANKLGKPLLIYEYLQCDYPWATQRFHKFMMEGMTEHHEILTKAECNYYGFLEDHPGTGKRVLKGLCDKACFIVSDEYPVHQIRNRNVEFAEEVNIPFHTVDSNGMIPLGVTEKAPYSAYLFRKIMQKNFIEAYLNPPLEYPLENLKNISKLQLSKILSINLLTAGVSLNQYSEIADRLTFNNNVKPVEIKGTRQSGLKRLDSFLQSDLLHYGIETNHPDKEHTSRLSPWLHFGKISEFEIVKKTLDQQPPGWDLQIIKPVNGKREGFFQGYKYVESFLDQVITWREVGFHFSHHVSNYDAYESLPDWVLQTLEKHAVDERPQYYSFDELNKAQTADPLWNAAQRELVREGRINNYLRMLWGKKVIEWTSHPRTALSYLIQLNDQYAMDGRDPNSYCGIMWIFGRFDRPWPERPIFGKVRYMSSSNTRKKVQLRQYLKKYASF